MHVVNLGICLLSCGSVFRVLLRYDLWAGETPDDQLALAYEVFRTWTRQNKIPYPGIYNIYIYRNCQRKFSGKLPIYELFYI